MYMSLLHLIFASVITEWRDDDFERDLAVRGTDDDHQLIANISNDITNFKNAFRDPQWEVYNYQFDPATNRIHLWVRNPTGANVVPDVLKRAVDVYGPDGTWKEGDIRIVDDATARSWGYDAVLLEPGLQEVWLLVPAGNGEYAQHQVDVAQL